MEPFGAMSTRRAASMSPVAVRPGKGSLSEPTAATQPWPRADQPHASARSSSERREYLLRHALELAFLVVSGNPEQDSRRSGLDVPLQTLNAIARANDLALIEAGGEERRHEHRRDLTIGHHFGRLVPLYRNAIGRSGGGPAALADLTRIILNDGVRPPTVDLQGRNSSRHSLLHGQKVRKLRGRGRVGEMPLMPPTCECAPADVAAAVARDDPPEQRIASCSTSQA